MFMKLTLLALSLLVYILVGFKLILFPFFQTTLLPFNIDQLIGSSSDELSAVIHWHRTAVYYEKPEHLVHAGLPHAFICRKTILWRLFTTFYNTAFLF